jgi:UDP-2,3-diacylglucosamine pyrophosphatase LpxH
VYDAVIISDTHLGSDNCQAKALCHLLESLAHGRLAAAKLILNGDVFNSIDFRRLRKSHWKVLSQLRKLSDKIEIIWLCGNHDGSAEVVSHLLGVTVADDYLLESGGRRLLVLHGHVFDEFIDNHPVVTFLADCVYSWLQWIDKTHKFAKFAKKRSKTFLRCTKVIQQKAVEHARRLGYDGVCCGHTHVGMADRSGPVHYFNSGCWTERPCSYLTVRAGDVQLHTFDESVLADEPEAVGALPG